MDQPKKIWDVIIVGGGPAGCNAAIVLARVKRSVLLFDEGKQRNIRSVGMHNYLTRDGILPTEYLKLAHEELDKYHVSICKYKVTQARALSTKGFEVTDSNGDIYLCRRLLVATGVCDNIPNIPGMHELWGCSVFHCPYCDGWECCENTIGLYAKNFNGYGMALALKQLSPNIILFTDGAYYLKPRQRQVLAVQNIQVISTRIKSLMQENNKLTHIELYKGAPIPCGSLFVLTGHRVNGDLLSQLGCRLTTKGAAITNRHQQTNIPGVYVAGDASFDMHFVIVAAAEGAKAAVAIHDDLLKTDNL